MRRHLFAGLVASSLGGCASPESVAGQADDSASRRRTRCVPDGGRLGPWTVESTGYGCVKAAGDGGQRWLEAGTRRTSEPAKTHAFLLTGPSAAAPFALSARVLTVERTRDGSPPNSWEAAWLAWSFTDRMHFYYFATKSDGWELGKRDPAYPGGQRFLATGSSPSFPTGMWAALRVVQTADHRLRVYVDGALVADFVDAERPYGSGKVALYGEDCVARFADVALEPLPPD